jgi:hypothetical protein
VIKKSVLAIITMLLLGGFIGLSNKGAAELQAAPFQGETCDRECPQGFITQYLDALVAHKPDTLPLAAGARFTEDCKTMQLGEDLWKSITRLTGYRRDILDVQPGRGCVASRR